MELIKLKLHDNITKERLIRAGFRHQSGDRPVYRIRENLYKNTISLSIKIDLSEDSDEQIEWGVVDNNTGTSYNMFYFTPNSCKDLVRDAVLKAFDEVISELGKREILYVEGDII